MRCVAARDFDAVGMNEFLEELPIDVRDQVAESIDPKHLAGQQIIGHARRRYRQLMNGAGRSAERREIDPLRKPTGGRRESIASFKRAADRRSRVTALGQFDDTPRAGDSLSTAVSTPLSGATNRWSPVSAAIPRRTDPTPGSTTTRKIVAAGKYL